MATILINDDHPINRQFLMTLLSYQGYRLVEAADSAAGLAVVRAEHPDLMITDILMPTMDGYEFVRHLRADPTLAPTPVVFWSVNYLEREAPALAASYGVSHLLVKPCEPHEALRTVEAILSTAPASAVMPAPAQGEGVPTRVVTDPLAQQVEELSTVNLKLDALVEAGRHLSLERDLPRLLEDSCRAARDIPGAKWVAVGILEDDGRTLHHFATAGIAPEITAVISPPSFHHGVFWEVVRARSVRGLQGLPGDPQALGLPSGYPPVHALLGAAIFSPRHVYGCLCFADKLGADAFSEADERLAATLAAQLAVAYENARLYAELARHAVALEQEVAERTALAVLAAEVGPQAALPVDLNQIIPQVVELTHATWRDESQRLGVTITVRCLFPIALSQRERDAQPAEIEARAPLRILVVDDDLLIRRLLQDVLQAEGHVVTVAEGGRLGLAELQVARQRQEPFEVIITDVGMPDMDGREVAWGVKQTAPDTPVIMLTGWGQALRQDDALPPRVDHLLSKPPGLQALRTALRAVARPAGKERHA